MLDFYSILSNLDGKMNGETEKCNLKIYRIKKKNKIQNKNLYTLIFIIYFACLWKNNKTINICF